jgi:precorrin isomerase
MTQKEALKVAVEALKKQRKVIAFDANLYKTGLQDPHTTKAHEEYQKINEAIEILMQRENVS